MKQGVGDVVIGFIVMLALLLLSGRTAQAGNTTVVVSVSVGGGMAVGAVGWFIYLTYSERIAHLQKQPESVAMTNTVGKGLDLHRGKPGWIEENWKLMQGPGLLDRENVPPSQAAFVRFLEFSW